MPQFAPGESKIAVATFPVKPAALECTAELWLGSDSAKVARSGEVPFVSTGTEQSINLPITMPDIEGTYPVNLDVFSNGQLISAYEAIEDVVIAPAVGDFVYSEEFFELRSYREIQPDAGLATCYVVYRCTITNQGSEKGTRTVTFYYQLYSTHYRRFEDPVIVKSAYTKEQYIFELTLEPGQSYQFIFDPRIVRDDLLLLVHGSFIWYVFLVDNAGGESEHLSGR